MLTKHVFSRTKLLAATITSTALLVITMPSAHSRDRGVNQPGRAGNHHVAGAAAVGGSAAQTRAAADPGINQPGAVGNVGVGGPGVGAPGPGTAGHAGDPGVNQPGAAGNRR